MKRLLVIILCSLSFSCSTDESLSFEGEFDNDGDFIVFGNYFGFTSTGHPAVNIYKLTNSTVSKDLKAEYPSRQNMYDGAFEIMDQEQFLKVNYLLNQDYSPLINTADTVIGCIDCADGGGVYIELKTGSFHRFWLLDRTKFMIDENLHTIVDSIDSAAFLLNE